MNFKAVIVALLARTKTALLTYLSLNKLSIARLLGEIFLRPLIRITKSNFGSAGITKLPFFSASETIAAFYYSAFSYSSLYLAAVFMECSTSNSFLSYYFLINSALSANSY